jgi:hypothetical protein
MPISNVPVFPQTPRPFITQLSTVISVGAITQLYISSTSSGVGASKITTIFATNSDANGHNIALYFTRSGVSYNLGVINLSGNAGFTTTATSTFILSTVNFPGLNLDNGVAGTGHLFLASTNDSLSISYATAFTAGAVINVYGVAKDF